MQYDNVGERAARINTDDEPVIRSPPQLRFSALHVCFRHLKHVRMAGR